MKFKLLFLQLIIVSFIGYSQNTISKIDFKGNKKTKKETLLDILNTKVGQILNLETLNEDIEFIKRLPSIQHAYTSINKNNTEITIHVTERITILPEVNLLLSENRELFRLGVTEHNAFGKNITLGAYYQYFNNSSYGLLFKSPYLFNKKWGLGFAHDYLSSREPLYFNNPIGVKEEDLIHYKAEYNYRNISNEIFAIHQYNNKNKFEFGLNAFQEKYDYLSGADSIPNPKPETTVWKFLGKLYYQYYNIKHHFHYLEGFSNDIIYQYVHSANKNYKGFQILTNQFKYFKRVKNKGIFANRIIVGIANNNDSPFAPFVVDNHVNVRGVGDRVNRGSASFTINSEYRHTLIDNNWLTTEGNIYIDYSALRSSGKELKTIFKNENSYLATGLGVRFHLKNIYGAILRIDYGFGINNNTNNGLVIGLGQYF